MNTRTRIKNVLALAAVAMLAVATSANAAVVIDGTANWTGNNPVGGNFDASGSDKLVVIVTGEHGFNQTANGSAGDFTYDGVVMNKLVYRPTIKAVADNPATPEDETVLVDDTWNVIYYLDNPTTSTGLIEGSVSSRGSLTAIALSGTAEGAGNTVIGDRDSTSATLTTSEGSIVIASYGMGGTGNTAFINNVTPDDPLALLTKQNNGGGRWWDGHVTAYANEVAGGEATYSFTDTTAPGADGRTGAHVIAAEFLASGPSFDPTDLDQDEDSDVDDINMLTAAADLAVGVPAALAGAEYDLNGDETVNGADLDKWLTHAATINGLGSAYLKGDTNLDGDVDVWAFDGSGDAQQLSSNLGSSSDVGVDAAAGTAEALYDPATGELFFDIGTGVGVVGLMADGMKHGEVDAGSIFGAPGQNSGNILAYFNTSGLPTGEASVGMVLPAGLAQDAISFSYTPVGGATTVVPVTMIAVPEPSTIAMLVIVGLVGICCRRRRA